MSSNRLKIGIVAAIVLVTSGIGVYLVNSGPTSLRVDTRPVNTLFTPEDDSSLELMRLYAIPETTMLLAEFSTHPFQMGRGQSFPDERTHLMLIDLETRQRVLSVQCQSTTFQYWFDRYQEDMRILDDPGLWLHDRLWIQIYQTQTNERMRHVSFNPFRFNHRTRIIHLGTDGTRKVIVPAERIHEQLEPATRPVSHDLPAAFVEHLRQTRAAGFWETPVPGSVWLKRWPTEAVYSIVHGQETPVNYTLRFAAYGDQSPENVQRYHDNTFTWIHDGWSFGYSRLYLQQRYEANRLFPTVRELQPDALPSGDLDKIFAPVSAELARPVFTSLHNDTVLIASDDTAQGNPMLLPSGARWFVYTREPGGRFAPNPIEKHVPDGAVVSKFPYEDERLLVYKDGAFHAMAWDTGDMDPLFPR